MLDACIWPLDYCFISRDCCGEIPCSRATDRILMRKIRDERLTTPKNDPVLYFIQLREPVGHLLSVTG